MQPWWPIGYDHESKPKRKQNLICIFEESKYRYIHNEIIASFMNLLLIDEEQAFECLGTCTLEYKDDQLMSMDLLSSQAKAMESDGRYVDALIQKASTFEDEGYDTHILFGSAFYSSPDPQNIRMGLKYLSLIT